MKKAQVVSLVKNLQLVFDTVRLVDVSQMYQYHLNEQDEFYKTGYQCYAVWNKTHRCENCVSAKAYAKKGRVTKYEFIGADIYYVVAKYITMENVEYVLEVVSKISDEVMLGAFGKEQIVHKVQKYNDQLYKDSLTGTYNKNYYVEQLAQLSTSNSIAMVDIDKFKEINDTYGHIVGDLMLKTVGDKLLSHTRSDDSVIRYGGDEFLIVFNNISPETFKKRLEYIRQSIQDTYFLEYPSLRLTVSIGGFYSNEYDKEILHKADKMLYKAKRKRNNVIINIK